MGDHVFVQGLELYCVIGVQPWEREVRQRVRIDLDLEMDCRAAAAADDLTLGVDYRAMVNLVQEVVEQSSCLLVETLAERIATTVLTAFGRAEVITVRLGKPGAVHFAETVGVEITRRRST